MHHCDDGVHTPSTIIGIGRTKDIFLELDDVMKVSPSACGSGGVSKSKSSGLIWHLVVCADSDGALAENHKASRDKLQDNLSFETWSSRLLVLSITGLFFRQ